MLVFDSVKRNKQRCRGNRLRKRQKISSDSDDSSNIPNCKCSKGDDEDIDEDSGHDSVEESTSDKKVLLDELIPTISKPKRVDLLENFVSKSKRKDSDDNDVEIDEINDSPRHWDNNGEEEKILSRNPQCYEINTSADNNTPTDNNNVRKNHVISRIPPTEKKKWPQKRCVICRRHGVRLDTRYYCNVCNVALCKEPCFREYHCNIM